MEAYLEQFFREKVVPYRVTIEAIPLENRIGMAEGIKCTLEENVDVGFKRQESLVLTDNIEKRLKQVYLKTAQLGRDFGVLIFEKSGPHLRIGEDYAIVYSEIMALFGEDKSQNQDMVLELVKEQVEKDRMLRAAGVKPHHIKARDN